MAHEDVGDPIEVLVVDYWSARRTSVAPQAALAYATQVLSGHELDRAMCYLVDMCEDDGRRLFGQAELAWMRLQAFGTAPPSNPSSG